MVFTKECLVQHRCCPALTSVESLYPCWLWARSSRAADRLAAAAVPSPELVVVPTCPRVILLRGRSPLRPRRSICPRRAHKGGYAFRFLCSACCAKAWESPWAATAPRPAPKRPTAAQSPSKTRRLVGCSATAPLSVLIAAAAARTRPAATHMFLDVSACLSACLLARAAALVSWAAANSASVVATQQAGKTDDDASAATSRRTAVQTAKPTAAANCAREDDASTLLDVAISL